MSQATLLSVIGPSAARVAAYVATQSANVTAAGAVPEAGAGAPEVARLWSEVKRKPPVFALAAFDPLAPLVEAWSDRLDGGSDAELELQIGLSHAAELPDFYIVDEGLEGAQQAWYFELLYGLAPSRVMPYDGSADDLLRTLRSLPSGPGLPGVTKLAERARSFAPGTAGVVPQRRRPDRQAKAQPRGSIRGSSSSEGGSLPSATVMTSR